MAEPKFREVYAMSPSQMSDWRQICKAFADKIDAELLFVNETSCGVQYKDGSFGHILVEDMMEYLKKEEERENTDKEQNNDEQEIDR